MSYKEQLVSRVLAALPEDEKQNRMLVRAVIDAFATIKEPPLEATLTILRTDWEKGAVNRRPGNALLDWNKLAIGTAAITTVVTAAAAKPWLIPFAAILVWREVLNLTSVAVDKRDAVALRVMWENCNADQVIERDKAIDLVKEQFAEYQLGEVDTGRFERILDTLKELECIEIDDDGILVTQWVKCEI